jgi:hypothetical protein
LIRLHILVPTAYFAKLARGMTLAGKLVVEEN